MSLIDQLRSILGKQQEQPPAKEVKAPTPSPAPTGEKQPTDRRRRRRVNARRGTRVLIIDDSATIVSALKKLMNSANYVTYEAFDAETGLQIAQTERPDLIFLDIVLPGMSGFAALRLMRRDPKTQHIPIIMISGNEQATEQFYANRIGADDFMKKPFSRFEVFARIERLLDANHIPRRRNMDADKTAVPAISPVAPQSVAVQAPSVQTPSVQPIQPPVEGQNPVPEVIAARAPEGQIMPAPAMSAPAPSSAPAATVSSQLEARKELTAMGLQYFDQKQFIAAIQRGDKLAFELFVAGGGIDISAELDGKTPLQVARENGRTQIFALLRTRLASAQS